MIHARCKTYLFIFKGFIRLVYGKKWTARGHHEYVYAGTASCQPVPPRSASWHGVRLVLFDVLARSCACPETRDGKSTITISIILHFEILHFEILHFEILHFEILHYFALATCGHWVEWSLRQNNEWFR